MGNAMTNAIGEKNHQNSQHEINWNRFSFDGSIDSLNSDSSVKHLLDDTMMSLEEAFELGEDIWEMGNAPSTMIFMVCHEFEGDLLLNINSDGFEFFSTINLIKLKKEKMQLKISNYQNNWNRFSFDGSIVNLKIDSKVEHLLYNEVMTLEEAFELGHDIWILGNAPSDLIFMVSHDYDGEILKTDGGFELAVNELYVDKDKNPDPLMKKLLRIVHQYRRKEYDQVIEFINDLPKEDLSIDLEFQLRIFQGRALLQKRDFEKSLHLIASAEHYYAEYFDAELKINNSKRRIFRKNHPDIKYWNDSIFDSDEPVIYQLRGNNYRFLGEYNEALENFNHCLKLQRKYQNKREMGDTLANIGSIYYYLRDFDLSIEYYQECLEINIEFENNENILRNFLSLAYSYQHKQYFDNALLFGKKALKLSSELNNQHFIVLSYDILASTHQYLGNFDQAKDFLVKSFKLQKHRNNYDEAQFAFTIYSLILIYFQLDQLKTAKEYLDEFELFYRDAKLNYTKSLYKLINVKILIQESNETDVKEVKTILYNIINQDAVEPFIKTYSYLLLCDLLLQQIRTPSDIVNNEIHIVIPDFLDYSLKYQIHTLHIKTLILKYKLAILENDSIASDYLNQALILAHQNEKKVLLTQIKEEIDNKKSLMKDNQKLIEEIKIIFIHDLSQKQYNLEVIS